MPSPDVEKRREYKRRYKERHPERVREQARRQSKRQYELHKDQRKAALREWRTENRDVVIAQQRAWREKNRAKVRAYQKNHRLNNRGSWFWSATKKAAQRAGVSFDLDRDWFEKRLQGGVCELSGFAFDFGAPAIPGGRVPNGPSVDRIDPRGPYTKANRRLILWWLNRALSNMGEEYALQIFRGILRKRGELG